MKKILFVTPHLSTGGLPQFLLKKIESLVNHYDVHCIEWENITGGKLVVQRNQIVDILKDKFYSLTNDKEEILNIIDHINPDYIHFEEFVETFIPKKILKKIYSNNSYFIVETTHGTGFDKKEKKFIPDKLMLVSKGNYMNYLDITDSDIVYYPDKTKNRGFLLKELGEDPNKFHILNVGLFTPGKNQSEIIKYAKELSDYNVVFHFVGNQADNFINYWKPIKDNLPSNCKIWDERSDTHKFYESMDLFLFTSKYENRPLSVLEAIDHDMEVLMYNHQNYGDEFAKKSNVNFLNQFGENSFYENLKLISSKIGDDYKIKKSPIREMNDKVKIEKTVSALHILTDIDSDREIRSTQSLSKLVNFGIDYNVILSKRYTDLPPAESCQYPEKISMEPGGRLTPAHYGCYLGHRKAFEEGLKKESDYLLIFECDAVIDINYGDFIKKLNFACSLLDKTDLTWFSFGFHNNTGILEKYSDYWVVNKFYGAHAYLIPKKSYHIFKEMYENCKWNVADLLFVDNLNKYKAGIFEIPITKQAGGYSILDKIETHDRY